MVDLYDIGFIMTAVPVFVGIWLVAIDAYGLTLGLGLGWFPAMIVAFLAGALWPVLLLSLLTPTLFVIVS